MNPDGLRSRARFDRSKPIIAAASGIIHRETRKTQQFQWRQHVDAVPGDAVGDIMPALSALSPAALTQEKWSDIVDHQVSVILKNGERYEFPLGADDLAAFDPAGARHWIAGEFLAAGLETPNPMGKMLLVDQILLLALNFKPADYAPPTPAVRRFLCAALQAMGRPGLTIDLAAYKL